MILTQIFTQRDDNAISSRSKGRTTQVMMPTKLSAAIDESEDFGGPAELGVEPEKKKVVPSAIGASLCTTWRIAFRKACY
jgi:hypothetical protein